MRRRVSCVALVIGLACVTEPPVTAPGTGSLWGDVELVPAVSEPSDPGGYADPRLADARLMDYSRPGFAVVFVEDGRPQPSPALVRIREAAVGPRLQPRHLAMPSGGALRVANDTERVQVISSRSLPALARLEPGQEVAIPAVPAGAHELHLADPSARSGIVFAAPGSFAVVSGDGGWRLRDLEPGPVVLRAWHPRLPPFERRVSVVAEEAQRVHVEMKIDVRGGGRR